MNQMRMTRSLLESRLGDESKKMEGSSRGEEMKSKKRLNKERKVDLQRGSKIEISFHNFKSKQGLLYGCARLQLG